MHFEHATGPEIEIRVKIYENTSFFTHVSAYLHANVFVNLFTKRQGEQTRTKEVIEFLPILPDFYVVLILLEKHSGPLLRSYIRCLDVDQCVLPLVCSLATLHVS